MKILLAGPTLTDALRKSLGLGLLNAPPGTAQTPIAPLAKGLLDEGHSITIVTLDPSVSSQIRVAEGRVTVIYCPIRAAPRYRARTRALDLFEMEIRYLEAAIHDANPDIVHAHWTYEYAEAAIRSRYPHLVTMHDLGWEYLIQFRDAYRLARLVMKYRAMSKVRNLTVVSPFMISKLWQYGYFGPVTAIPNGIETPARSPALHVRAESLTRPKIVTVGNRERIKNVRKSVEAFLTIRSRLPEAELHLFGPGLDDSYTGGATAVIGHGEISHSSLMKFLEREATILIHPARVETFGVIIAEAKVRGVPVVAGAQSGGVPYVCGGKGAKLVDIESPEEISNAVLDLLSPDKYVSMSCAAYADAVQRFSNHTVTAQYMTLYDEIFRKHHK